MLLLVILLTSAMTTALTKSVQYRDTCGELNGRQIYLEVGVQGSITASTVHKQNNRYGLIFKAGDSARERHCSVELVTCPSCVISLHFTFLNISRNCGGNVALSEDCLCDHVLIFEVPYEEISRRQFCGDFTESNNASLFYISQTRDVTVKFIYSSEYELAFSLKYYTRRNQYLIEGSPDFAGAKSIIPEHYMTSPFFPKYYPRDASIEYIVKCKGVQSCKVVIIFTDFQISKYSIIEFFDWKGQRLFTASGSVFRPPILISPSPLLKMKFYGNGGTDLGFKAVCSFLSEKDLASVQNINTLCGGYVDNLGGRISMMNMIENGTVFYDCVWIVRPFQSYLFAKTHLYVKLTTLKNFDSAKLVIRRGSTSSGEIVETYFPQSIFTGQEHVVPINKGFYVSLKAGFQARSAMEIVYAAISYANCSSVSDFSCSNQRCISTLLYCDGFNHCGDNSDEPDTCSQGGKAPQRKHTANFYFSNGERYFDLKTVTVVFIISSLALISLMLSLIILLYRINVRGNNHRHFQNHFQAINDLLESSLGIEEEEEIIVDDVPPKYEAPPDYNDVVKRVRKSVKRNTKRKSVTKLGKTSQCIKSHQNGTAVNDLDQNSAGTSTGCNSLTIIKKSDFKNTKNVNLPHDINGILVKSTQCSTPFEGAKKLFDSLNIDLPMPKSIKEKLFTKRMLKDWQSSGFNSVRLSVSRRIFSASNLTLYSTDNN